MDHIVAVKWFKKRVVTLVSTCLKECNQVSTVARRVKARRSKIPASCLETGKDYNPGVGGVDLLNQKAAAYKLHRKSSGRYYLRLFF